MTRQIYENKRAIVFVLIVPGKIRHKTCQELYNSTPVDQVAVATTPMPVSTSRGCMDISSREAITRYARELRPDTRRWRESASPWYRASFNTDAPVYLNVVGKCLLSGSSESSQQLLKIGCPHSWQAPVTTLHVIT